MALRKKHAGVGASFESSRSSLTGQGQQLLSLLERKRRRPESAVVSSVASDPDDEAPISRDAMFGSKRIERGQHPTSAEPLVALPLARDKSVKRQEAKARRKQRKLLLKQATLASGDLSEAARGAGDTVEPLSVSPTGPAVPASLRI